MAEATIISELLFTDLETLLRYNMAYHETPEGIAAREANEQLEHSIQTSGYEHQSLEGARQDTEKRKRMVIKKLESNILTSKTLIQDLKFLEEQEAALQTALKEIERKYDIYIGTGHGSKPTFWGKSEWEKREALRIKLKSYSDKYNELLAELKAQKKIYLRAATSGTSLAATSGTSLAATSGTSLAATSRNRSKLITNANYQHINAALGITPPTQPASVTNFPQKAPTIATLPPASLHEDEDEDPQPVAGGSRSTHKRNKNQKRKQSRRNKQRSKAARKTRSRK